MENSIQEGGTRMIPVSVFLFLAAVAGALALYSFLERTSWMFSQITAAGLSTTILWTLAAMLAAGNVGDGIVVETGTFSPQPILDSTLTYLFALFAVVMTLYFILHIANWVLDRVTNQEEEEE